MTASLTQQTIPLKDASAVRKRRRRTPAGGASDDCFACSKKNIKCDRRRPYCSQCLEVGSECSGYKTQLTWGVGVASRGKLRGLSLPIAKAPPVPREPKKASIARSRSSSTAATCCTDQDNSTGAVRPPIDIPTVTQAASAPATPYGMGGYDYLSMGHHDHHAVMPHGNWTNISYSTDGSSKYPKFTLPLVTEGLSSSIDTLSEVDYMSPMSQSFTRDEIPYVNSPSLMYDGYTAGHRSPGPHSPPGPIYIDRSATVPTTCPGLVHAPSEPSSSLHSHMDHFEAHMNPKLMRDCDTLSAPLANAYRTSYDTGSAWPAMYAQNREVDEHRVNGTPFHWPVPTEPQAFQASPELVSKMPFFVDYYENVMCPSMVFIDGPHNPFRTHILQLARGSQSLQHAICALASCNLRMKRKLSLGRSSRQLSEKLLAELKSAETSDEAQPSDITLAEEYQHRNLAVHLLNRQLNDPVKSSHDSVLATILLLCHYRMVESGIAKFHTQFAGVKKILALRLQQDAFSEHSTWMEALFTYFDAISASINDREAQLQPDLPSDGLHSMPLGAENFVGCDGELFNTISKLGRLNLLSQHRSVRNNSVSPESDGSTIRSHSPLSFPLGHAMKSSMGLVGMQGQQVGEHENSSTYQFDGNGFGTLLNDEESVASALSAGSFDDKQMAFWNEWKEARVSLQNWQFDPTRVSASLPGNPTSEQIRDLGFLSETFRYAALLYTERLVNPNLPASHQSFRDLVSQVVYYASNLEAGSSAEKFLLWPLFVAGSECVNELQQSIVRTKCQDIMARSGYMNNLAALDVLEKLWAEAQPQTLQVPQNRLGLRRGPFSWTKCIGGPGIEVEWIMF